jgi:hypothetical protein
MLAGDDEEEAVIFRFFPFTILRLVIFSLPTGRQTQFSS